MDGHAVSGSDGAVAVVETRDLRKRFGETVAVAGVNLSVGRGEVFGFLGPNGAGKTTTIKLLLGLCRASGGHATVLGRRPGDPVALRRIGFLPEHFRFPPWLNAAEFLDFHARLYGIDRERRRRVIPGLLERVGLADRARSRLGQFSKGMLQRIGLAQAILNEPELVILDEPTSGLDPVGRREVKALIRELRASGTAVFLNSHLLSEVESICDRVAILKKGRVIRTGTVDSLTGGRTELEVRAEGLTESLIEALRAWGSVERLAPDLLRIELEDPSRVPTITEALVRGGARVHALAPRRVPLEDLFVRILAEAP